MKALNDSIRNEKDDEIKKLLEIINEYKEKYNEENATNKKLIINIEELEEIISAKNNEIESLTQDNEKKTTELITNFDREIRKITNNYENVLLEKDNDYNNLNNNLCIVIKEKEDEIVNLLTQIENEQK